MLQLIYGISGTGKTSLLYQSIKERASRGEYSLLLVPEQFTSSTEQRIYQELGDAGSGFVTALSFTRFAERVLQACGGVAIRTLTEESRTVLVRRALEQVPQADIPDYYSHRRNPAFCQMAAQTIEELKSAGLDSAGLRQLAAACGASKRRLTQLALIFGAYEALLTGVAMDPGDRIEEAARRLEAAMSRGELPDFLQNRAIYIDEFDTFNAPKRRLMAAMLAACPSVSVTLCMDQEAQGAAEGADGLFAGAKRVANTLKRLARENNVPVAASLRLETDHRHQQAPGLLRLNALLSYGPEPQGEEPAEKLPAEEITLFSAESREQEAAAAAAWVKRLAAQGVRYSRVAVVCREIPEYRAAVRAAFRLAEIPLYCDEATTPEFCAPAQAVLRLLDVLCGASYSEALVELAKTGLTGCEENAVYALENYCYTWRLTMADWRKEFTRSPQGFGEVRPRPEDEQLLALCNRARALLVAAADKLKARCKGASARQVSRILYETLCGLKAEEAQQAAIEALRQSRGLPAGEEAAREWNIVMGLLDQMADLLGEEPINPKEYRELFALLLRSADIGHIPQMQDAVILAGAGKMRLDEPDYVLLLGLADGEFPRAPGQVGLLTEADRDALIEQQVELPDCFENKILRENVCFYKAMTIARKGLWLSWPGRTAPVTTALLEVQNQFDLKAPQLSLADRASTPGAALDTLGSVWSVGDGEAASLYALLQQRHAPQLRLLQRLDANAARSVQDTAALRRVLTDTLKVSASQMENYYSCAYGYFMRYVLGLRPRQRAAMTANQSGSLIHWVVQQALMPEQGFQGKPFVELDGPELRQLTADLCAEYVKRYLPESGARFAYQIHRLEQSALRLLAYLQAEQRQGKFRIAACEQKLGEGENAVPSPVYALPGGQTVRLVGSVDRADLFEDSLGRRWLRVVDYKTGSKDFDLNAVYCGLDCQMLLYLFALCRDASGRFTGVAPAGVLYLLADPGPGSTTREQAGLAPDFVLQGMVAREPEVLAAMDADNTGKYLPFTPKPEGGVDARQRAKVADERKFARIERHVNGLVRRMAQEIYEGRFDAAPLVDGADTPCRYCDFLPVCGHLPGVRERKLEAPKDVFELETPEKEGEEHA